MKKIEIRKQALNRRKALSSEEVSALSNKLLNHFSKFDFSAVKTIHIFLPMAEKNEPDTFLFIEWLTVNHPEIKIIVPKADFETALMSNHSYQGINDLEKNIYNILEPQSGKVHTGDVDLVIVPLLAFDLTGYRVGYGKGFYDRFLANIDTRKIGVSFFEPLEKIEDMDENDIKLDLCLTPGCIYNFTSEDPGFKAVP